MEADYNWEKAGEYLVNVDIYDTHKDKVFHATITMWISKRNKKALNSQGSFILFLNGNAYFTIRPTTCPNCLTKLALL